MGCCAAFCIRTQLPHPRAILNKFNFALRIAFSLQVRSLCSFRILSRHISLRFPTTAIVAKDGLFPSVVFLWVCLNALLCPPPNFPPALADHYHVRLKCWQERVYYGGFPYCESGVEHRVDVSYLSVLDFHADLVSLESSVPGLLFLLLSLQLSCPLLWGRLPRLPRPLFQLRLFPSSAIASGMGASAFGFSFFSGILYSPLINLA